MSEERQETTMREVYERLLEGTFYDDYDWAAGPGLRAAEAAVKAIDDLAVARKALEPFARCGLTEIADSDDDEDWAKMRLLVKDYRAALAALPDVTPGP